MLSVCLSLKGGVVSCYCDCTSPFRNECLLSLCVKLAMVSVRNRLQRCSLYWQMGGQQGRWLGWKLEAELCWKEHGSFNRWGMIYQLAKEVLVENRGSYWRHGWGGSRSGLNGPLGKETRQYEGSEVPEQIGKKQIKPLQNSPLLELGKIIYF